MTDETDNEIEERIVMTPCKRGEDVTCIAVERVKQIDTSKAVHVAGGQHQGIVINRGSETENGDEESTLKTPPQLWLEFKVFLKNEANNTHSQERRTLKFWFKPSVREQEQMNSARDFFKELVSPHQFPRDYVGFIKKVMKLFQNLYPNMRRIEVELRQLASLEGDENIIVNFVEERQTTTTVTEITIEKVLELTECAYPNAMTVEEVAKITSTPEEKVISLIANLADRGLIRLSEDKTSFTRVTRNESDVKRVRQMPAVTGQQQPTIAIITAKFCEKVAIDAVIENKKTFVRYKTEGESNVYTLGNIGHHRVVATKLPAVGHRRDAMIAAGNTTTRLLGTFQNVEYVILVGCGGGVPHYTDYRKHVRLGDVVVSDRPKDKKTNNFIYLFAEKVKNSPSDEKAAPLPDSYNLKTWLPPEDKLQIAARQVVEENLPWKDNISDVLRILQSTALSDDEKNTNFSRPDESTDKLFMSIGGNEFIEVAHPCPSEKISSDQRRKGEPMVHFGAIASGEMIDENQRQEFAEEHGILAFDNEFDSVVESVYGNRKDNYIVIRGIADYMDGSDRKDWQNYSAVAAASFMKAVIENLN